MEGLLEELDVDVPVGRDHAVAAVVHVVGDVVEDGLFGGGPYVGVERFFAEEFVDGAGGYGGQKLTFGIGPVIGVAGLQEQGAER